MGVPLQDSIYIAEINLHKINKGGKKTNKKTKLIHAVL